ncbi:polyprenyl synthetase family protein [Streptomyces mirabilis]
MDLAGLREAVEDVLAGFLAGKASSTEDGLPDLAAPLRRFVAAGGKRLRPLLALIGWHAAGAHGSARAAWHLAASLEMFHAFALIHDDVMDRSEMRRGQPTVHRALASSHHQSRRGDVPPAAAEWFGQAAAILVGDLALVWSDEILHAGRPSARQLTVVLPLLQTMRTEIVQGQYLDLYTTGCPTPDTATAWRVIRYKTAKYTVERPLHLGAALAGADRRLLQRLSAYAIPAGEAFQLRDDLLGAFGDPAVIGKPALDDLRAGKHTVLAALALQRATPAQARELRRLLGDPELSAAHAATVRELFTSTGARAVVEELIAERHRGAVDALDDSGLPSAPHRALRELADAAAQRLA